jgi:TonB family protein
MLKLDESSPVEVEVDAGALDTESELKQRRQMLIALALLLVALVLVLIKDRDFWFPSPPTAEEQSDQDENAGAPSQSQPAQTAPGSSATLAQKPKPRTVAKNEAPETPEPAMAPVVTNRAVLPPLEVEVVAGDEHRVIQPGSASVKVDLQPKTPVAPAAAASAAVNTNAERVHLSAGAVQMVSRPVEPTYPLLAKQMKVQGAVVLQALIGKDGDIQDLHVLSGPAILSAAAREAVKQWRFRPYLQSGQAVETEARITVNFTISTQ